MNISVLVLFYYVYVSMAWICTLCIQYTVLMRIYVHV